MDEYAPQEMKLKLKLAKNDKDAYEKLFDTGEVIENSSVTGNYNYSMIDCRKWNNLKLTVYMEQFRNYRL